ncbi:MAG: hypothetical protein RIQ52_1345 [Pseudomonadota bacterium]
MSHNSYDVQQIRRDFPILEQTVHGFPLVYLDNAASNHKPLAVMDAMRHVMLHDYANVHRGVHTLSQRASEQFEQARHKVRNFIHAAHDHEIIFVRGATEGINLVAQTFGRSNISPGDRILISAMEHHANIVPWQMLRDQTGAELSIIPMAEDGSLLLDQLDALLDDRVKLVAVTHMSNALGTLNPVADIIRKAHARGIPVLLDGAQSTPHMAVDVQALDCDFFVFSGHKLYGPTGIGVLYGKTVHLENMPPWQGGGDMIRHVTFEKTTYSGLPWKFEAGTPAIIEAIGLGAAIDYLETLGMEAIARHEHELLHYATEKMLAIPGLRMVGTAEGKGGILSFTLEGIHPHDIGTILDHYGVAVRAGHHCAMPVMDFYGIPATARASLGLYNTHQDIDRLVDSIQQLIKVFH